MLVAALIICVKQTAWRIFILIIIVNRLVAVVVSVSAATWSLYDSVIGIWISDVAALSYFSLHVLSSIVDRSCRLVVLSVLSLLKDTLIISRGVLLGKSRLLINLIKTRCLLFLFKHVVQIAMALTACSFILGIIKITTSCCSRNSSLTVVAWIKFWDMVEETAGALFIILIYYVVLIKLILANVINILILLIILLNRDNLVFLLILFQFIDFFHCFYEIFGGLTDDLLVIYLINIILWSTTSCSRGHGLIL